MIVIGADAHKRSHTVAAVDAAAGRVIADRAVRAKRRSFEDLLLWARGLGGERVWAIEDCRHVSGALERSRFPSFGLDAPSQPRFRRFLAA